MLSAERPTIPILALDHDLVLSAWQEIGGDIFTCGDVLSPATITLDLSDVELSLKQSSSASLDHISNVSVVPNLFPSFSDLNAHGYGHSNGLLTSYPPHDKQQGCWAPQQQAYAMPQQAVHMAGLQHKDDMRSLDRAGGGSSSSISSSSIDIAVVPEVSSQPAMPCLQGSPGGKVPQVFLQNMLPSVPPPQPAANRMPGEGEAWRTRRECLERYKEKKARRMYTKKIRYQLRKINADKRPRIKGRFVKKEELDEYMKCDVLDVPFIAKAPEDEMSDVEEDDVLSDKELVEELPAPCV